MAPVEFHRYVDARGDTIIYKFDPEVARNPDPAWPNDSAVTVYHHYILKKHCTINHHSDLLPLDLVMDRWRNDKQSFQPIIGMVMYKENNHSEDGFGAQLKTQYMWKGWHHGEGYRRGWAKLEICGLDGSERVTVAAQDKGKEPASLEPFPRVKHAAPPEKEGRKDSKDLQIFGYSSLTVDSQSLEDPQEEEQRRCDILGVLKDTSLPDIEPEVGLSELPNGRGQVVEAHEQEQEQEHDPPAHKKRKNKHNNRRKKMPVDYRLKMEHWPGLLHTPR